MTIDEFSQHALENCDSTAAAKPVVVCGNVDDKKLWAAFSLLNVAVLLTSPPCQPWSKTGRLGGLATFEGLLFPTMLEYAAFAHVHAVLCENVAGFPNHHHYHEIVAKAAVKGLRLVDCALVPCQRVMPVIRNRWLGVFMHVTVPLEHEIVKAVEECNMPSMTCAAPAVGPRLAEADAIHVNISCTERELLAPSKDALQMLKRAELLPPWLFDKVDARSTEPTLQARLIDADGKLSGVMARYGSQRRLPLDLLKDKGLRAMLFGSLSDYRYFSPWEVLASLGFPAHQKLSIDLPEAFQQTGNAL